MCGIAGIFDLVAGREQDRDLLVKMTEAILHRGPDGSGEHYEPGVALGHRRLSIIDVAAGQQPLFSEDGTIVTVFNGEIYNYLELRQQLIERGYRFRTNSDTEVLVYGWHAWGESLVERLNGMFAFAIHDRGKQTLFLARDRLGKKPLYYTQLADGRVLFASELKALMVSPDVKRTIDPRAVEDYFSYGYVPDPRSIFESVSKLRAAHSLTLVRGRPLPAQREYWDVKFRVNGAAPAEHQEELIKRLKHAVDIRLMSEVPLGAFLSGGVDSSAVVALMAQLSGSAVNTCSISFGDPQYDESQYAQAVAQQYHTNHRIERVESDDFDLIDDLVAAYDEPFADSSAIPTYRVCELARKNVTVALSGDGGDEVFAGYRRYRWHLMEERVRRRVPLAIRKPIFGTLGALYPKIDWAPKVLRAKSTLEGIARDSVEGYFHSVSIIPDRVRLPLYSKNFLRTLAGYRGVDVLRSHAGRADPEDPVSFVQYLDLKTYLPGDILVKVDRASMAHSLEVRAPLLDYNFVEWACTVPSDEKLHFREGKLVFKKSLEKLLPADILYRPKMGFGVPIAAWLRGPLRQRVREDLLQRLPSETDIFDRAVLTRLVDQHQSGARDHSAALWALLMFGRFHRRLAQT
jgi:asparagine synthase (glutamine-hydrolysing)